MNGFVLEVCLVNFGEAYRIGVVRLSNLDIKTIVLRFCCFFQFMSVVNSVKDNASVEELSDTFRDEGLSNYIVVYLRLIASCQLQSEADFYQNFVDGGKTVKDFCKTVMIFWCNVVYFF